MSDGNENRPHTQRNERIMVSSVKLDWFCTLANATDFSVYTQLGAVPYRMIIKQCISSTFYCSSLAV